MSKNTLGGLVADGVIRIAQQDISKEVAQINEDLTGVIAEYPRKEYSQLLNEIRRVRGIVAKLRQHNLDLRREQERQQRDEEEGLQQVQERQRREDEERLGQAQEQIRKKEDLRNQQRAEKESRKMAEETVAKEREPLYRPEPGEAVNTCSGVTEQDLKRAEREMNLPANYRHLWQ